MSLGTNIKDFIAQLTRERLGILSSTTQKMRSVVAFGMQELIAHTPVDTGHAKANWFLNFSPIRPAEQFDFVVDTPVGSFEGRSWDLAKVKLSGITLSTKTIYITNQTDYIERIMEEGHSPQVPPGTLSVIEARIEAMWENDKVPLMVVT